MKQDGLPSSSPLICSVRSTRALVGPGPGSRLVPEIGLCPTVIQPKEFLHLKPKGFRNKASTQGQERWLKG